MANSVKIGPFRIAKNQQRGKWLLDVHSLQATFAKD
jgi:hypothetical protein